jgi:hypothetical protein
VGVKDADRILVAVQQMPASASNPYIMLLHRVKYFGAWRQFLGE